jgi:WD40 repeat protein
LTAREGLQILEEEVQRLPEVYRLPVTLCCLHGGTQEEAARQLGWTPGSVKGRLERGRKRLQRRLAGRGLGLATALALVEVSRAATKAGPGARLVASTALAATAVASRNPAGCCLVSTKVLSLAEKGLPHVALAKVKLGLMLLFAVGAVAAGLAASAHQLPAWEPPALTAAESSQSAPEAEPSKLPNNKEKTDRYGDALPAGAVARLGSAGLTQAGVVPDLAFSPDGKVVATCGGDDAGEDRRIHLWDVATGKEVGSFPGDKLLTRLCFSPSGKLLASGGWQTSLRLWDIATGKERCRCGDEAPLVRDLAFSPDGKLLAAISGGEDGYSVTLWDTDTGKNVRTWKGDEHDMSSVAFSGDGATLATAGPENSLRLWNVADGTEQRRIEVGKRKVCPRPLAFAQDGKMVALANDDHSINLWDPATGRELPPLRGHKGPIRRLAFSKESKTLVSTSADRTIRFWDTATAKELRAAKVAGEVGEDFWDMALSPDEKVLATRSGLSMVRLFDISSGKPLHPRDGHTGTVEAVGFLPQGDMVASVGGARVVRLAEAATGKERHRSESRPGFALSVVLSQEYGSHLIFSPVALSRDCSLVAVPGRANGKNEATVRIWEVASDREVASFTGDIGGVSRLAFSPNNKALALAYWDKTIRVWDTGARKEVQRLTGHKSEIFAVEFSPDGKLLASGCDDKTARVWELATGKEVYQLRHETTVLALAFSPDGKTLASAGGLRLGENAGDTGVHLWELATGQERAVLSGNHHLVRSLAFAPDGKVLALGSSDGTVRVWDLLSGKELRRFEGHRGIVNSVAFSRDGKRLVSGSTDATVVIWDTSGLATQATPAPSLSTADREALWRDLSGADAGRAYRAMTTLHADGMESVRFLKERLKAVPATDARQIARWVADLDADDFEVRQKATAALAKLGELAEPALRRALADRPSTELRSRAETLLEALAVPFSPEQLRALRAVEVLEHLATPEARELLAKLGRGAPEGRLTREARAALERCKK